MSSNGEHAHQQGQGPRWEREVLGPLDPAAHEAPPARGSARYTTILEAAMTQTTETATVESAAPAPVRGGDRDRRQGRRSPRRRWVVAASAAAGLAAAATIGFNLLPGGTSTAYAAYTPVPQHPSTAQAIEQAQTCARSWSAGAPAGGFTADDVLLAEERGNTSITVVRKGDGVALCEDIDPRSPTTWQLLSAPMSLPAGRAVIETIGSVGEGEYAYSSVAGQLGAGVTGVDVVLPDGTTVRATTAEGRWVAWWPGMSGSEADAVRIVVRTSSGEQRFTADQLSTGA